MTEVKLAVFIMLKFEQSDGIATGYGLDSPGIESRWGRDFPHLSRPVLWPTEPPVQWVPGHDADLSPPSSAEVYKHSRDIPLLSLRAFVTFEKSVTYLNLSNTFPLCYKLS
jgi:hypothetical protein